MTYNDLMRPKNDYVFKRIFGDESNKDILKAFLQSIIKEKITDVKVLNNELTKENIADKKSILDIRATINDDIKIDIEIQVQRTHYMPERSLYYWSKIYGEQLMVGQEYKGLTKTICINIVDFVSTQSKTYHSIYNIREENQNYLLTDVLEIHFVEIPKLERADKNDKLSQWIEFINGKTRREMEDMAQVNSDIDKALEILKKMSMSEEERAAYLSREMALLDEATRISEAEREGMEKGIQEGIEKGIKKGIKEGMQKEKEALAINLLDILDDNIISEKTGLDIEVVKKLRKDNTK